MKKMKKTKRPNPRIERRRKRPAGRERHTRNPSVRRRTGSSKGLR